MELDKWIRMLSWNKTEDEQVRAIEKLSSLNNKDLIKLVQPYNKDCWHNAAIVLKKISYPNVKGIISELLAWLKDMNWPGAMEIYDLVCTIPKNELMIHLEKSILEAKKTGDDMWLYWLKDLAEKMKIKREDFIDSNAYLIINDIHL